MTRCREPVPLGHYDSGNAEDTYNGEVDKSRLRGTIEGVVQPGHEGAHDQEGDARVVKPEERGGGHRDNSWVFDCKICWMKESFSHFSKLWINNSAVDF